MTPEQIDSDAKTLTRPFDVLSIGRWGSWTHTVIGIPTGGVP